jgi:adenosylmethionine-8-amino-7-oxononanoate aminotransferase
LKVGHRVVVEARARGVIVRPLGDVVVLMPPLSISKADLRRLVAVVAESIVAATAEAYPRAPATEGLGEEEVEPAPVEIRRAA